MALSWWIVRRSLPLLVRGSPGNRTTARITVGASRHSCRQRRTCSREGGLKPTRQRSSPRVRATIDDLGQANRTRSGAALRLASLGGEHQANLKRSCAATAPICRPVGLRPCTCRRVRPNLLGWIRRSSTSFGSQRDARSRGRGPRVACRLRGGVRERCRREEVGRRACIRVRVTGARDLPMVECDAGCRTPPEVPDRAGW